MTGVHKTVRELLHALLDLSMTNWGDAPTADSVVQFTADGEMFWSIDEIYDEGEGGVVARIVPFPPDSHSVPRAPSGMSPIFDSLQRCVAALDSFIFDHPDPGTEALGAVWEAKALLRRMVEGSSARG